MNLDFVIPPLYRHFTRHVEYNGNKISKTVIRQIKMQLFNEFNFIKCEMIHSLMPLVHIKHTFIQITTLLASVQICMPDNTLTYPWSYMIYKSLIYYILNAVIIEWCTINWIVGTPGTLYAKFLPRRTLWRVRMWYYVEDSIFENSDDEEGIFCKWGGLPLFLF